MALTTQQQKEISQLSVGVFGAALGATNFNTFATYITSPGATMAGLYEAVFALPIAQSGQFYPTAMTNAQFATKFVNTLVGSNATDANKQVAADFVAAQLNAGMTRGAVAKLVIEALAGIASTDANWGTAAKAFTNKVTVATFYSIDLGASSSDVATLQGVLSNVTATSDVSTSTAINTLINGSGQTTGSSFVFTTSIDSLQGTAGNDTFTGDWGVTNQVTAADVANGGAGTDTLKLFGTVGAIPTIQNIENIYLKTPGANFDVSTLTGVTQLEVDGDAGAYTFTATTGQTVRLSNNTGANTTTIAGNTPTSLNVQLNAFGKTGTAETLDLSGTALTTVNIAGDTAASVLTLTNTGAKLTTVNVSGAVAESITTAVNSIKTVNASTATAAVTFDESGKTTDNQLTFTGGSGNDTVIFKAAYLTSGASGDVLDGGAGTDVLQINDTTPVYAAINAAKNFETLSLGTTGATVDIAQITNGINQFNVASGNLTETFNNALSTSKFTIVNTAGNTGTVTVSNKVGETATSITIDNQAGSSQTLNALTLTGVTNVALASTGKSGSTNVITTLTNVDNSAITVTGSAGLTMTVKASGTAGVGSKVDASAATGVMTLTGNTQAYTAGSSLGDILIGGTAADVLKAAVNGGTLTGNAGNDTFNVSVALGATSAANAINQMVTVTDFTKGDKLTFANTAGAFTTTKVDLSAAASLSAALDILAAGNNSDLKWGVYGGNTYIVDDVGAGASFGATDTVVKLTGTLDLSTSTYDGTTTYTLTFA